MKRMQTYGYRFPASGHAKAQPTFTISALEKKLREGPDCLMAYAMFPIDQGLLSHVSIDMDDDEIKAVEVHTYAKLWDGNEGYFRDCVQENLDAVAKEHGLDVKDGIWITGDVQALGLEGDVPDTLYHITEKENVENILENGLEPRQGENKYKVHEDCIFLAEKSDIVAWITMLPNLNNPAILEVSTEGLENIETGRRFADRSFTNPAGHGEYVQKSCIPPENISVMELTDTCKEELANAMEQQLIWHEKSVLEKDTQELMRGIERLSSMGVDVGKEIKARLEGEFEDEGLPWLEDDNGQEPDKDIEDEGLPWLEDDNGQEPSKDSWNSEEEGAGLTEALGQMTLEDFGMKLE